MRGSKLSEGIASEPCAARGDDASENICSIEEKLKRNFMYQKVVAVH